MIELLLVAMLALQAKDVIYPPAYTGTYQTTVMTDGGILRTDTRHGTVEFCTLTGTTLVCAPVALVAK